MVIKPYVPSTNDVIGPILLKKRIKLSESTFILRADRASSASS